MKVQDLIFADYAAPDQNGKFTLVGAGFNEIATRQLPLILRQMFVLIRLRVTVADIGRNRIQIRLIGERGKLFTGDGAVEVKDDHKDEHYLAISIPLFDLKFEETGEYRCEVNINGTEESRHILRIRLLDAPKQLSI